MDRYIILCFDHSRDTVTEYKTFSPREANGIYKKSIGRGCYSSVTLRIEKRTHGYALRTWSVEDGEVVWNVK